MTRKTNARLAGFMFLFYIATAYPAMILTGQATRGEDTAAKIASIAHNAPRMRAATVLSLITVFDALVLAVALYALTRDCDPDIAMLALSCRIVEGGLNAVSTIGMGALLWLVTGPAGALTSNAAAANAIGAVLLQEWPMTVAATVFAAGSTLFSYLFLRARSIPVPLAWLGLAGSALLVVGLPAQLAGLLAAPVTLWMWVPVALFEVVLGFWLLIKGVAA